MTGDERGDMVIRILGDPKYTGCWYDNSVVWLDERPMPTDAELNQAFITYTEEQDKIISDKAAAVTYSNALEAGYVHTDGYRYYCNERATTDMVKAITLFGLNSDEPLPVLDMDGGVHQLMINDFRILANAIGIYQYGLRLAYWSNLGAE